MSTSPLPAEILGSGSIPRISRPRRPSTRSWPGPTKQSSSDVVPLQRERTPLLLSSYRCDTAQVLRARPPAPGELAALAQAVSAEPFTYTALGATADAHWPNGYRHDRESIVLGDVSEFETAVTRLAAWQPHVGSGVLHAATGDLEKGTTVALAAPVLAGWVLATCRIVYVERNADSFAWAYGTLPLHPEEGEERFEVSRDGGGTTFSISAFSRPRHWLARATPPLARRLQRKATQAYLAAMRPQS